MARRKKTTYIEYDYEASFRKNLTDLEEENMVRMLREGKVRSIYATKEIRAGDQLDIEIYPEFTKGQKEQIPDDGRKEKQKKAQKKLNEKNSQKMCERTIAANFDDGDIWATLTYSKGNEPERFEEAQHDMTLYINRLNYERKKKKLPILRYVYTIERSEKGRYHIHLVCDGDMGMELVETKWKKGRRNQVRRLQKDENGLSGMGSYISKDKKHVGKYKKVWKASKGLKKPVIKKNHYKFKQRDIDEIVTGRKDIREKIERWYRPEKYRLSGYEIRYNEMNGRFYISARLFEIPKNRKNNKKKERKQE